MRGAASNTDNLSLPFFFISVGDDMWQIVLELEVGRDFYYYTRTGLLLAASSFLSTNIKLLTASEAPRTTSIRAYTTCIYPHLSPLHLLSLQLSLLLYDIFVELLYLKLLGNDAPNLSIPISQVAFTTYLLTSVSSQVYLPANGSSPQGTFFHLENQHQWFALGT